VRRQFRYNLNNNREDPGILQGTSKPNYKLCVEIVAKAGLREMIKPGLLAVFSPIVVGVFFKQIGVLKGDELLGAKVFCYNDSVSALI
jgi:Na+/H+-translocating membrane pyrophosphatase